VPLSVLYSAKRHIPAKVTTVIDYLTELTRGSSIPVPGEGRLQPLKPPSVAALQLSSADFSDGGTPRVKAGVRPRNRLRQMSIAAAKNSRPD
jgi:hypothetical protein